MGRPRGSRNRPRRTRLAEIEEAAQKLVCAMEATIYFAPTVEEDGPVLPQWKQDAIFNHRLQEMRALVELKRALGI